MIKELEKEEEQKTEIKALIPEIKGAMTEDEIKDREESEKEVVEVESTPDSEVVAPETKIFAVRTTANREDQVMDFIASNAERKKLDVYTVIRPHGMRGYIFLEAGERSSAEQAAFGIPYSRGLLPNAVDYKEIEHMLEQVKKDVNIQKNDIAEIISGPFKREKCKITRVDKQKEEVVVELLEAAVPIPITVKMDSVKVIRREDQE
jgi:transcription termination/antitermination protein NusG